MSATPHSLLEELRQPVDPQHRTACWDRFVELFSPLLYNCACKLGVQGQDAEDLVQDVFVILVRKLPTFQYDPQQSFHGWLRAIQRQCWHDRLKRSGRMVPTDPAHLNDVASPDAIDALVETEYRQQLVQRALLLMQRDFEPASWQACWETKVLGQPGQRVADKLGMTVAGVHAATYRVLRRLRGELEGFLDL